MTTMTITLSLDDDAMQSSPDPKHEILGMLARSTLSDGSPIYDYSGNKVGSVRIAPDPEPYYGWEKIPTIYNWAAFDACGDAYTYKTKPVWDRSTGSWGDEENFFPCLDAGINDTPPEKSLRKRPEK